MTKLEDRNKALLKDLERIEKENDKLNKKIEVYKQEADRRALMEKMDDVVAAKGDNDRDDEIADLEYDLNCQARKILALERENARLKDEERICRKCGLRKTKKDF